MSLKRRVSKLEQHPKNTGPLSVWHQHQDEALFRNRQTGEVLTRGQLDRVPGQRIVVTRYQPSKWHA